MRPPAAYVRPAWYDHDSAHTVVNGTTHHRLADPDAFQNLHRQRFTNTMNWYRHEHEDDRQALQRPKLRSDAALENARKMNGTRPEWISSNGDAYGSAASTLMPRVTSEGQEYRDRNLRGAASQWWTHDNAQTPAQLPYRVGIDGYDYASRARNKSENWFDYSPEENPPAAPPKPRLLSVTALALKERGHGKIQEVLHQHQVCKTAEQLI